MFKWFYLLFPVLLFGSCRSSLPKILDKFEAKTAREKYRDALASDSLKQQWMAAANTALEQPVNISLPYHHKGYFNSSQLQALALKFNAVPGQRLTFTLQPADSLPVRLYTDVFVQNSAGKAIVANDTLVQLWHYDVLQPDSLMVRLQPTVAYKASYYFSIETGPSLSFPVAGSKARAGSFWGAARDGGKRSHEGVDIFAPKGTAALAGSDGIVTGVREGGIGGKTVWMRSSSKDIYLYYAHLDSQLVQPGQRVQMGDTLGLVGNTGNARTTPAHLHFGIYTQRGPLDPWPFIDQKKKKAIVPPDKKLNTSLQLVKTHTTNNGTVLPKGTLLEPLAITNTDYVAAMPQGFIVQVPLQLVKPVAATALQKTPLTATF